MNSFLDDLRFAVNGPYALAGAFIALFGLFAFIAYKTITNSRKED